MSGEIVVLRTYASEFQARLDATILEANGVPTQVSADTAGGAYPLLTAARLLVRAEDAALAAEILDAPADLPPEGAEPPA